MKQEILDFEAMLCAIDSMYYKFTLTIGIERLKRERQKVISKIETAQLEIEKLQNGKTTFNNLLKTQNGKQNRISDLHTFVNRSHEIQNTYKNVINGLIIFMAMKEIPQFRIWKQSLYYKCITTYCTEVSISIISKHA